MRFGLKPSNKINKSISIAFFTGCAEAPVVPHNKREFRRIDGLNITPLTRFSGYTQMFSAKYEPQAV